MSVLLDNLQPSCEELHFSLCWALPISCTHLTLLRFISQYHPKNVKTSKEQNAVYIRSRVKGFLYLYESGYLDDVFLVQDQGDDIIKLMDTGKVQSSLWIPAWPFPVLL